MALSTDVGSLGEGPIIIRIGVGTPARRMFEGVTSVAHGDYPLGLIGIGAITGP